MKPKSFYKKFDDLVKYFVIEQRWELSRDRIEAGNLVIYYRDKFNEWRMKDVSKYTTMDLTTINFPLDAKEKARIWGVCSYHFKTIDRYEKTIRRRTSY